MCKKPLKNRPCQARPTLVNTNFNKTLSYSFTAIVDKCGGSCNTNCDPYI